MGGFTYEQDQWAPDLEFVEFVRAVLAQSGPTSRAVVACPDGTGTTFSWDDYVDGMKTGTEMGRELYNRLHGDSRRTAEFKEYKETGKLPSSLEDCCECDTVKSPAES